MGTSCHRCRFARSEQHDWPWHAAVFR
jgi:hypothetical protein